MTGLLPDLQRAQPTSAGLRGMPVKRMPVTRIFRILGLCVAVPGIGTAIRVLALVLMGCLPLLAAGETSRPFAQATEENTLLLELRIGQITLADSLSALQIGNAIYLPLGETARLLTIAIRVNKTGDEGNGFVRGENRAFHFDARAATVSIADATDVVNPASFRILADDIYVESTLLSKWLRVELPVNRATLSIVARPLEPLPLEQRLLREKTSSGRQTSEIPDIQYPFRDAPYLLASVPMVDQTLTFGTRRSAGASRITGASTTFLKGDLLGLQSTIFVNRGTDEADANARITLGRTDPEGTLLGFLHATAFAIGSVSVPGLAERIATSDTGNGFSLTNTPLNRPSRFSSNTLQGDLPPGWDVELFYNEGLVAYQQSRPDGKYVFSDLPVFYGQNEFRLVFHGPQGQLRVERRNYLLDDTLTAPGQFNYDIAMHRDRYGLKQSTMTGEWGIGPNVSLGGGILERQTVGALTSRYFNASLHAIIGEAIFGLGATKLAGSGQVIDLSMKTQLARVVVNLDHTQAQRFQSESPDGINLLTRSRDQVMLSGALPGPLLSGNTFMLRVVHDTQIDHTTRSEATSMLSTPTRYASFSNSLHWKSDAAGKTVDGTSQVGASIGALRLRGQVNYYLRPEHHLDSIALSSDVVLRGDYLANVTYLRSVGFARDGVTASLNKSFGKFALGVSASVSRGGESSILFQIFTSVGRDPRTNRPIFDAVASADSGAMSARVFLDKNRNGIFDAGEPLLPNIGFVVNQGQPPVRTDENGVAFIGHLPPNRQANIGINLATIEDPTLSANQFGVRFLPRPGNVMRADFPIIAVGEVDGTITVGANVRRRGAADVLIEIVETTSEGPKVVATARSGGDGYYVLQGVPEGTFVVRPSPKQMTDLGIQQPADRKLTIQADKMFVSGQDFVLIDKP